MPPLRLHRITHPARWLLLAMLVLTTAVYWPGLSGGWLFDDYPNIVDNKGVQPDHASIGELVGAALSSPSSEFKRPLSSLSFASNFLAGGLDPWGWKLVNLVIHLLNGLLVFWLARGLLGVVGWGGGGLAGERRWMRSGFRSGAGGPHPGPPPQAGEGGRGGSSPLQAGEGGRGGSSPLQAGEGGRGGSSPQQAGEGGRGGSSPPQAGVGGDEATSSVRSEEEGSDAGAAAMARARADGGRGQGKAAGRTAFASPPACGGRLRGGTAALIAGAWMLLPINLTGVLYVVQRMESLANLFVLLGVVGYVAGRRRMLAGRRGLALCIVSLVLGTAFGVTAKETAVMLPLYAFLVEWIVFGFWLRLGGPHPSPPPHAGEGVYRAPSSRHAREGVYRASSTRQAGEGAAAASFAQTSPPAGGGRWRGGHAASRKDWRIFTLFVVVLLLPMFFEVVWIAPHVLDPATWATRDFTLGTRLMSEARIVVGYIAWTLVPLPQWLSFYHDDFQVSSGLLSPWTTLASFLVLAAMVTAVFRLRRRWPLVSLGIALFLGCHVLTGTILPLELIYEHRNYFASFGLLLALIPVLAAPGRAFAAGPASRRHSRVGVDGTRNLPMAAGLHEGLSGRVDSGSSLRDVRNDAMTEGEHGSSSCRHPGAGRRPEPGISPTRHPGAGRRPEPGISPPRHPGAGRRPEPGIHVDSAHGIDGGGRARSKMDPGFLASRGPRMTRSLSGFLASRGPRMTRSLSGFLASRGPRMTRSLGGFAVSRGPGMTELGDHVALPLPLARWSLLAALGLWWIALTLATSIAWGSPLRLAQDLAMRAPDSPRAQYELGRTYIIYSHYDPASPFTPEVYAPLERAAKLPDSSILPEQALIFFNARMHRQLKDAWWDSMIAKLKAQPPGVQDESSLIALTRCAHSGACKLPPDRMLDAFLAALSHPNPNARLLANYGDFAWNILNDHQLGLRATRDAVDAKPGEPAYRITLARMYLSLGDTAKAQEQVQELERLNYGGRLDGSIAALKKQVRDAR